MLNDKKDRFSGKVAIASNDQKRVTGHIGKCRSFVVYEIDDDKIVNREIRKNLFTNHRMMHQSHQHHGEGEASLSLAEPRQGRHSHTHLINGLKDCSYLISRGGGWRVVEDLKQHNITTLFAEVELIEDAVNKFIKGELKNDSELICNHGED